MSQCTSCNAEFPKPLHSSWMVPHEAALTLAMIIILEVHVKLARHICLLREPPLHSKWKSINVYAHLNVTMIMTLTLVSTVAQLRPPRILQR